MDHDVGAAVLVETSVGNFTIDLYTKDSPKACQNFIALCQCKLFNMVKFHSVQKEFIIQTGKIDKEGGSSIWGLIDKERNGTNRKRFFDDELQLNKPNAKRLKHTRYGTVAMANQGQANTNASQFYIQTTSRCLDNLDGAHTIFGQVVEGQEVLKLINDTFVDKHEAPVKPIYITHTVILASPFPDPPGIQLLLRATSPALEDFDNLSLTDSDNGSDLSEEEHEERLEQMRMDRNKRLLAVLGDLEDENMDPPDNVLFICKLNKVTEDQDLELIFSRFGAIQSCEIIRDRVTGDSLQYGFIEFESREACERAYLKMNNVLIDDRRIKVDFSQSVAKVWNKFAKNNEQSAMRAAARHVASGDPTTDQPQISATGRTLKYRQHERGPDRDYVLEQKDLIRDAFELMEKQKQDERQKRKEEKEKKTKAPQNAEDDNDAPRRKRANLGTFTPQSQRSTTRESRDQGDRKSSYQQYGGGDRPSSTRDRDRPRSERESNGREYDSRQRSDYGRDDRSRNDGPRGGSSRGGYEGDRRDSRRR